MNFLPLCQGKLCLQVRQASGNGDQGLASLIEGTPESVEECGGVLREQGAEVELWWANKDPEEGRGTRESWGVLCGIRGGACKWQGLDCIKSILCFLHLASAYLVLAFGEKRDVFWQQRH